MDASIPEPMGHSQLPHQTGKQTRNKGSCCQHPPRIVVLQGEWTWAPGSSWEACGSEGTRQSLGGSGYAVQARCDRGTRQIFSGQEECQPSWEWQCTVSRLNEANRTASMRVVPALCSWGYSASRNLKGTWDPELGLHSAVTNLRVFMLVQQGACSLGSRFLPVSAGLSLLALGKNTVSA